MRKSSTGHSGLDFPWAQIAMLAVAYFTAAKLGIGFPAAHGVVTPVWAPTGISLAALLLFGPRLWPGVFVGALAANASSDISIATAAGIAVGNTAEAMLGVYLLRRVGFDSSFRRSRDVLVFVVLGAMVSTIASATIGTATLRIAGEITGGNLRSEWALWWFGDLMGDLLVAPFLLVWITSRPRVRDVATGLEAAALIALPAATAWLVFFGGRWKYPYLLFPPLIWATVRFKQHAVTLAMPIVAAIGIWGTVRGSVPIGGATLTESVQILQALIGLVAVSLLLLAASLSEREQFENALAQANSKLAEAQEIAHIGSWEWDAKANTVVWSDELYRIFGCTESDFDATFEGFLARWHPDDRDRAVAEIHNAISTSGQFSFVHRIVRQDGTERAIKSRGRVVTDEAGDPLGMIGTGQDVTEQMKAQEDERRLRDARRRQQQALELNDEIVQGLATAKLAAESGDDDTMYGAISDTLDAARAIVDHLLAGSAENGDKVAPGDFVRSAPAALRSRLNAR